MLAHCSAGVGRTGAFIAVASLLRLYAAGNGPDRFPMAEKDVLSPLPKIVKDDPVAKVCSFVEHAPSSICLFLR